MAARYLEEIRRVQPQGPYRPAGICFGSLVAYEMAHQLMTSGRPYIRAGLRARIPAGALVHALRHNFGTSALEAGADVVELQTLLGHTSLDPPGLRHVVRGDPGQVALRAHLTAQRDNSPPPHPAHPA